MKRFNRHSTTVASATRRTMVTVGAIIIALILPVMLMAQRPVKRPGQKLAVVLTDSATTITPATQQPQTTATGITTAASEENSTEVQSDTIAVTATAPTTAAASNNHSVTAGEALADERQRFESDSIANAISQLEEDEWVPREVEFSPDPTKAVWYSALFPGLGQVYNRRYWKLPIIVGGYLGLAYATNWNNSMLRDYNKAYADLLDNDPSTRSYMDLFSPNVKEENFDKSWLQSVIRSRKNYFRRNRDLCIIGMVGVYLLAMVDAYVDASLSHFDISPDLSMDVAPSLIQDGRQRFPSVGLMWAINF